MSVFEIMGKVAMTVDDLDQLTIAERHSLALLLKALLEINAAILKKAEK